MGRIILIDYGRKRCGMAVTDPLQIVASVLGTKTPDELIYFLKQYFAAEKVDRVVVGYPLNLDNSPTDATPLVDKFLRNFKKVFPEMPIDTVDERMSSKMASQAMLDMGMKKKDRMKKSNVDEIAAVMMLQDYLLARPS